MVEWMDQASNYDNYLPVLKLEMALSVSNLAWKHVRPLFNAQKPTTNVSMRLKATEGCAEASGEKRGSLGERHAVCGGGGGSRCGRAPAVNPTP